MTASIRLYRRYLLVLCGGLLLFFGARWAFLQDRRDRLREIPARGAELFDIQNGVAYFSMKEGRGPRLVSRTYQTGQSFPQMLPTLEPLVIQSMPVAGGPASPVGEHRLQNVVFHRTEVTDNTLYYVAYAEKDSRPLRWEASIPGIKRKIEMGVILADASFYALSLGGGAPVEPLPGRRFAVNPALQDGEPFCVVGDKIYWIEIDPEKLPPHHSASLKVATRKEGVPKTLMTGLSAYASLVVEKENAGIVWIYAPPADVVSTARKIYRLDIGKDIARLFLWSKEDRVQISRPVTLGGRVYWKRDISSGSVTDHDAEIVSAAPDGSDSRVETSFVTSAMIPAQLYPHTGAIYYEITKGKEADGSGSNNTLMRLTPGTPPTIREIIRFPAMVSQYFLDGDYLYYTQEEERGQTRPEGSQGSFPIFARVLRRYPLPH